MAIDTTPPSADHTNERTPFADPALSDVEDRLIPAAQTRRMCGNISDMTLYRWITGQGLKNGVNFPQPTKIAGRRYWWRSEVIRWLRAQDAEDRR